MSNPLISIIVPIYNVENYLADCIKSIKAQTYKNIEIILVNDGSTDRCQDICDEFAKNDNRIKVIHKANGGLISARKAGLQISNGEYIGFIDSDDWVDADMYEKMLELSITNEADIVASGFSIEYDDQKTQQCLNNIRVGNYTNDELTNSIYPNMLFFEEFNYSGILPSVSNKLFKKHILYKNMMQLDERISNGEDAACLYLCILDSSSISITDKCWYHYRVRNNSMSRELSDNYLQNIIIFYNYLKKYFEKSKYAKILIEQLKRYTMVQMEYGTKKLLGIQHSPFWLFPYKEIEKNSKIILYGAGEIGQTYFKQLQITNYCDVTLWTDKNYKFYGDMNYSVDNPENILSAAYDYVVIAINNENIRKQVTKDFIEKGIQKEKIIAMKPIAIANIVRF